MEDNINERFLYHLVCNYKPVFVSQVNVFELLEKHCYFKIKGDIDNSSLEGTYKDEFIYPEWYQYVNNNCYNRRIVFLIIDMNNVSINEQKRFISLVKDRSYQSLTIPDNCKIVVISDNKDNVDKELFSNLLVI